MQALQRHPDPLTHSLVVPELGHVISEDEGDHQAQLEQCMADVLTSNPESPSLEK